jgi:beta-lactam-binding protein with PASTA domain
VIATSPPVGDEVHEGESIDIVVSAPGGAPVYLMPDHDVAGPVLRARETRARGFRVASVRYEDREGVYPNTIVDQKPKAGDASGKGESIELVAASSQ